MDQLPGKIDKRFTKNMILEAMDIVLKTNIFIFDDTLHKQITGTAMGTKMAPTYANSVLGYLETILYDSLQENSEFKNFVEKQWKRYLDDAYITWDSQFGDITSFADRLNNLHPKINFTMDINPHEIPFLDIKLIRMDNKIISDIYHKNTDTFNYLPFKSCHPRHIKRNIPFTLARRIRMLCEEKNTRKTRYEELKKRLTNKGFPDFIIDEGIRKAENITDEEINTTRGKDEDERIVAISTHNPNNPNMESLVQSSIGILQSSQKMENTLKKKRIIFAKRQPPSLKGLLCRAAFSSNQQNSVVSKCGKNCETCKLINEGSSILITSTNKSFYVKYNMNCNTRNVLYIITCGGCNKQYIGETGNELKTRMTVHRQQIRDVTTRKLAVSSHIATCGKGKFSVFPFYKMQSDNTIERRIKENNFINTFKPELNSVEIN